MKTGTAALGILLPLLFCVPGVMGADSLDTFLIAKSTSEKYSAIACDNGTVAWIDYGSGTTPGNYTRTIYRYTIATGRKDVVIRDTSWKRDLAVSGNRYVWSDGRGIFLYDEARERLVFLYSSHEEYSPCIDGSTVLWVEERDRESYLVTYDAVSGTHRTVASSSSRLRNPAISGDRVVYLETGPAGDRILLTNLTTGKTVVLCDEPGSRDMPAIDGNQVVWADGRNGTYQVYRYDLASGISGPVSPSGSFQMYPDISGDLVVWEEHRVVPDGPSGFLDERGDIRLYNQATNLTETVATGSYPMEFPRVSGSYVVWSGGGNDTHDIFLHRYSASRTSDMVTWGGETGYATAPTAVPARDTRVRYYSTLTRGEIEWYSLEPPAGTGNISFELRWSDPAASLSLAIVSPGDSAWRFTDSDDSLRDQAIRMTLSATDREQLETGTWTVAVAGDPVSYDLCWY